MPIISLVFGGFRDADLPPCARSGQPGGTAAEGYAAYNRGGDPATPGLNYQGLPCPEWDALPPNVRAKWEGATALLLWQALSEPLRAATPEHILHRLGPEDYIRAGELCQHLGLGRSEFHALRTPEHPLLTLARWVRAMERGDFAPTKQIPVEWFDA